MTTANINVRMDAETKKEAEQLFQNLGLNMSTAVNLFIKQALRERRIPFIVGETVNTDTLKAIEEGRRIAIDPTVKGYTSISDLREALEA